MRTYGGLRALLAAAALVSGGCSVAAPSDTPAVSIAPSPECRLPTAPPADEPLPADLDEATREAVVMRAEYGLRRDLAWIRQVAADPRAVMDFGVPMLPEETESLFARNALPDPVRAALGRYGHVERLGGYYIDNELGGVVVVLWTADVAELEAAIRPLLPRCHPVAFRQVRWSEAELRALQDRIVGDMDWLGEIPAAPQGVGADIVENIVRVDVSSANPDAPAMILAHYDAPAGMIRVTSDGTGAALLGSGTVKGRVLTVDGKVPGVNDLMVQDAPGGPPGHCGGGDMGFGVLEDGTFEYPCQIGRRTIQIVDWREDGEHMVVGEVTVDVPLDEVVATEVRLDLPIEP